MMEHDEELGRAIELAFNPKEPVMIGAVVSAAATGTLSYLSFYGMIDNDTIGVITGLATIWLPIIGMLWRSQYTPLANRDTVSPNVIEGENWVRLERNGEIGYAPLENIVSLQAIGWVIDDDKFEDPIEPFDTTLRHYPNMELPNDEKVS